MPRFVAASRFAASQRFLQSAPADAEGSPVSESSPSEHPQLRRTSLVGTFAAYVDIARPSHWMKNVFMLPGMLLAWAF